MFFSFLIIYKKNLDYFLKKYGLCHSSKIEYYMIRHFISINSYLRCLSRGENIPLVLLKKIESIQKKYMLDSGLAKDLSVKNNVSKNNLEENLCRWLALAKTIGVDPKEYARDMMMEVDVPILSQRYLNNKLRVS
jgi:hypothetical protein